MDAKDLKNILGDRAKEIIQDGLGLKIKGNKAHCTNPLAHKNGDKDKSMYWSKSYSWVCTVCEENLDIFEYLKRSKNMSFPEAVEEVKKLTGNYENTFYKTVINKSYNKPKIKTISKQDKLYDFFSKRCISRSTVDHFKVTVAEKISQNGNRYELICFQYFEKENGELEFVTYRSFDNNIKGGREENTRAILYGLWYLSENQPLVIVEGQIDAMSVYEAGITNVVSVPSGAKELSWMDNNAEILSRFPFILVFSDNDEKEIGMQMAQSIQKRFSNVNIIKHDIYKDANDLLMNEGHEALSDFIMKGLQIAPDGCIDASTINDDDVDEEEGIETGLYEIDSHLEDLKPQELTILFGRNGEGKTTLLCQMITHFIQKRNPVFLYNGELAKDKVMNWIRSQVIGKDRSSYLVKQGKYKEKYNLKPNIKIAISKWIKDTLYISDNYRSDILNNDDKFFNMLRLTRAKYDIKVFVIDNLMSKIEESETTFATQSNFTQKCKDFAIQNHCHVILVCHPNKVKDEVYDDTGNDYGNLDKKDIMGSGNIANKADNIISVERNFSGVADNEHNWNCIVKLLKDRNTGERKVIKYRFDKRTFRFYNEMTPSHYDYDYRYFL